ncbi:MAG TPA: cob(I)yrinic acid a,c-diamide adenosyltransferase [Candidatus Paceibacterota bacterium]
MALFTGKGDDGTTYFFGSKERFGKDTPLVEALGTCDELNSLLGFVKAKSKSDEKILEEIQQNLFIIQAELAGAGMRITEAKVKQAEELINNIEKKLPPIKTFFIPGANEISALFDLARTVARRTERRVVALVNLESETPSGKPCIQTLAYLNRLSSVLYALARYHAQKEGQVENKPHYK